MEEYVWISKVAHDPVFCDRSHPILLRLAEHFDVKISIAEPENPDRYSGDPVCRAQRADF
jgi:hypothetical protein